MPFNVDLRDLCNAVSSIATRIGSTGDQQGLAQSPNPSPNRRAPTLEHQDQTYHSLGVHNTVWLNILDLSAGGDFLDSGLVELANIALEVGMDLP